MMCYQNASMHRFHSICVIALLAWFLAGVAQAAEFKLANGNTLKGEVASTDEDGLVVKLDVGGFSVLLPGIAPLIFLSLPARVVHGEVEGEAAEAAAAGAGEGHVGVKSKTTSTFPAARASGLSLAAGAKSEAASAATQAQIYTRGEFTFNRRF